VVTLCNLSSADPAALSRKVAEIYLEKNLQRVPAAVSVPGSDPAVFAGKYYDSRNHFPLSFALVGEKLVVQGDVLRPIDPNRFADDTTGGIVTFSNSGGRTAATVNWDNQVTFTGERIPDLHLDEAGLAAYAGVYRSAELDATYTLSVEKGSLMLRMNSNRALALEPVAQNDFAASDGATIVFRRDRSNRVSGLGVFGGWDGWMRDESFNKLN